MRAIRDAGASLSNRIQQSKDYFVSMIDTQSGTAAKHNRKAFMRAFGEKGKELGTDSRKFQNYAQRHKKNQVNKLRSHVHTGKMFMFSYDPKYSETLPYYDMLPLILLMEVRNDHFLGLNLHYLPPRARAMLLDAIVDNEIKHDRFKRDNTDKDTTVQFDYQIMKRAARSNLFKPCVKKYLFSHVRSSSFLQIPGEDWEEVIFLPFEQFRKADKRKVWRDSMAMR